MKLRKTLKMLVPILALAMIIGACNKAEVKETKETKDTTAETTTTETTEKEDKEEESEDIDDDDDSVFVEFDYSDYVPDQNIEIDENYLKFYDYDAFYTSDFFPEAEYIDSTDGITNEIIKEEAQKLLDQGYLMMTAEESAKGLSGTGINDEDGMGIAYLYNGIIAWKETNTTYDSTECYIASQDIVDQMGYILTGDENGILTYKDDPKKMCPSDAEITYDPEKELLTIVDHYEWDASNAPVG